MVCRSFDQWRTWYFNYGQPKLVELNHTEQEEYPFSDHCILSTRTLIFNLKIFSNFKISTGVKYGVGLSLFAKKMQQIQLF